MRCPKCRKAIPIDSTSHAPPCGWKAATAPPPGDDQAPAGAVPSHPPAPPEPPRSLDPRAQLARMAAMMRAQQKKPKSTPLEHWRRVRDNPQTLPHIREQALAAIDELERRGPLLRATMAGIAQAAHLQERAREVTREQLEREARDREAFMRRRGIDPASQPPIVGRSVDKTQRSPAPASAKAVDRPPMRDANPAPSAPPARFSREDMAPDPLEIQADARPADPRRSGAGGDSRGTSRAGASQRPNRSGYARARRT